MPVVQRGNHPAFKSIRSEGAPVISGARSQRQEIRPLHFGLLNLMPDAALAATDRQWVRSLALGSGVAQIETHFFTLPLFERGKKAQDYIAENYEDVRKLRKEGLDGLIITGANLTVPITDKEFWGPLVDVMDWARENVTSTLMSCAASHIYMASQHDQVATRHDQKRWGVYRHRVVDKKNPLVRNMNTVHDAPHSRFGDVSREQFLAAGMKVLVESPEVGVHMATSKDGFRQICLQGHPEYDDISLLKEFTREIKRFHNQERQDFPPPPRDYLNDHNLRLVDNFRSASRTDVDALEKELSLELENTWRDSTRSFMSAWIDAIYQLTHFDRDKPFMKGVDPSKPLMALSC